MLKQTGLRKLFELRWTAESGVESDDTKLTREDQYRIMILIAV